MSAVTGQSNDPNVPGVYGSGRTGGYFEGSFEGVHAISHDQSAAGVAGYNDQTGPGIYGNSTGGFAGYFEGNVQVTGDVILAGGDCAEDFDTVGAAVDPGSVLVIDASGRLRESEQPYDRRVAGVVSGAGGYRPGIVLDRSQSTADRVPVALTGKTCCKVDADYGAIDVGDLLTTSPTPGHAMKATNPARAFGAVIGKALQPCADSRGLIPILVALQ